MQSECLLLFQGRRRNLQLLHEKLANAPGAVVVGAGLVGTKAVCTSASGSCAKQGVELAAELAHFFPRLKAHLVQTCKALLLVALHINADPWSGDFGGWPGHTASVQICRDGFKALPRSVNRCSPRLAAAGRSGTGLHHGVLREACARLSGGNPKAALAFCGLSSLAPGRETPPWPALRARVGFGRRCFCCAAC